MGCLRGGKSRYGARQGTQNLAKGAVQSAQLVMVGGVVLALLLRALLARVPGRVRVRHLLREQQREDAKIANEFARSHDSGGRRRYVSGPSIRRDRTAFRRVVDTLVSLSDVSSG